MTMVKAIEAKLAACEWLVGVQYTLSQSAFKLRTGLSAARRAVRSLKPNRETLQVIERPTSDPAMK